MYDMKEVDSKHVDIYWCLAAVNSCRTTLLENMRFAGFFSSNVVAAVLSQACGSSQTYRKEFYPEEGTSLRAFPVTYVSFLSWYVSICIPPI